MNRRRLLQLGATLFAAPAIVRAESLMRVCLVPPKPDFVIYGGYKFLFTGTLVEVSPADFRAEWERIGTVMPGEFEYNGRGIITIKRPNYSETRLWPESD